MDTQELVAIILGAGTSGLAVSACLNRLSIPNIILEREDCFASMWKKKAYDRLHLHLPKQYCELPHMPFPTTFPSYIPIKHLKEYIFLLPIKKNPTTFPISTSDPCTINSLSPLATMMLRENGRKVKVQNTGRSEEVVEEYSGRFLVVASGETSDEFVPEVKRLDSFGGEVMHSTKCGEKYRGKRVLVVGIELGLKD